MIRKITIHLDDGRVIENANFARVLIQDDKPGIQQRCVESLVQDAEDLADLQAGRKVLVPFAPKKQQLLQASSL